MGRNPKIIEQMRDRQRRVFRVALDPLRYGLTLRAVEIDSGLGYDSLRNYASGETIMPLTALDALVGVIPDELLSLLLPGDRAIVRVPVDLDLDGLADSFADFLHEKNAFHHPESEAGRELSDNERAKLANKIVHLPIVGRAA